MKREKKYRIKRLLAFTLAETMIALAIVGVVSSLVLPNVIANYRKNLYVTSLKKVYNDLTQAMSLYMTENHKSEFVFSDIDSAAAFLNRYLKVSKVCNLGYVGCFTQNQAFPGFGPNAVMLESGAAVWMGTTVKLFVVDINGTKGPNKSCQDIFRLPYWPDGSIDTIDYRIRNGSQSSDTTPNAQREANFQASQTNPEACFGKILNDNWEMNY